LKGGQFVFSEAGKDELAGWAGDAEQFAGEGE